MSSAKVCGVRAGLLVCPRLLALVLAALVLPPRPAGAVVAFGDSLVRGLHADGTLGRGWPLVLAQRAGVFVTNAGIGGNALTLARPCPALVQPRCTAGQMEPSALARLDADALWVPGARTLVVLLGINDLLAGVPALRVEAALRSVVRRAQRRGLRVVVLSMLPAEGCPYLTRHEEAARRAVNRWLLAGHLGPAVSLLDTAPSMGAPGDPNRLRFAYDSGDGLHPNDAGYLALAVAVASALQGAER